MSRDAVAAVLARDDLACGDRLAAFSLASYAGRWHRAFPGATASKISCVFRTSSSWVICACVPQPLQASRHTAGSNNVNAEYLSIEFS